MEGKEHRVEVLVGVQTDKPAPSYYIGIRDDRPAAAPATSIRGQLTEQRDALQAQVEALTAILATDDPERAERYLEDGVHFRIAEIILRPPLQSRFDDFMKRHLCDTPSNGGS